MPARSVLAGAEAFVDIARFDQKKIALWRRFPAVPLWDAIARPPRRHFRNPRCHGIPAPFRRLGSQLIGVSVDVIAFDGKTLRGSAHKKRGKAAIHMVSAFAARQRLALGHLKMADKSNGIVAIPATYNKIAASDIAIARSHPGLSIRSEGPAQQTLPRPVWRQPFVTTGGGGALPLPTKQPVKLNEATTKANASATFFTESPHNWLAMAVP